MKRKIVSLLVLTLILTNILSMTFLMRPSLEGNSVDSIISNDFMDRTIEKTGGTTLPSKSTQPNAIPNGFDNDWRRVFEKPRDEQGKALENSSQTAQHGGYNWDFNDTSKWNNLAYKDGNKTRLIVGVNSEEPTTILELEKIEAKHLAKTVNTVSIGGKIRAVVVELLFASVTSFAQELRDVRLASYIEPDMKVETQFVPNDPYWGLQWGPRKIEAEWAWNTTVGSQDVLVAVADTGIDYSHPDLMANYVPLGYDWVNMDSDPLDDFGHGTHCAGIVAATLDNGVGIAGLAQVRFMAEKILDNWGSGYWDWVANGIIHATDQGANIISMSLGGSGDSDLVHEAVRYAYDAGVLVIAAAGNSNSNMKFYPAAYDEVIAVAATDEYDQKAGFSNWGDWIELAAPGVDIYSTMPTYYVTMNNYGYAMNYDFMSGTSMACPHVAGLAALVWSRFPNKARDWLRLWLRYTADDLGDLGFDIYYGYGRVNARKAVEQPPPAHELIASDWTTPPYVEPGASGTINATILNFGENNEPEVTIQLLVNNSIEDSRLIGFLASGGSTTVDLVWSPTVEGLYNVTLYVVPVPDETSVENNVLWRYIYVGIPVKAVVLHSSGNIDSRSIITWQALNDEWYQFGGTMVYIDHTTLNKEDITYADIAATAADVLIISCAYDPYAGWEFADSEIEAITQYVREGHGLVATAGTLYSGVPNNNKMAPLFGLNETTMWTETGTDLLHLVRPTHPIFADVPDPLVFPGVGSALPYDGRWDSNELVGGKYLALGHYQESAIITYRGLVFISPWLEIIPPYYHHHLQLFYNAITWSRYEKPQHELVVSLEAPKRLDPGESTLLNATVSNGGRSDETNVQLQLSIDGELVDSATISMLLVDSSYTLRYLWKPTVQGIHDVTAYAPPVPSEEYTENNIAKKSVRVLLIIVRNALVYSDDYAVPWRSRYVIAALDNLGIEYTYYSDDPWGFGAALVSQPWDLVVVDHCNYFAIGDYWTELDEYVRNGGLLVLSTFDIDGSNSELTTLWDTLGVSWVSDMWLPEPVYRWAPSHPIFTFPNALGDLTSYLEGYSDDGDHVAATTGTPIAGFTISPAEGYAGLVVGNTSRTVLFSFILDEFRSDQNGDGKLDAVELWENAIFYLARGFEHDLAVTLDAPAFLQPGTSILLNAPVRNRGSSNETDVELQLLINGAIVNSAMIPKLLLGESYPLSYLWTPTVEGTYNITVYASPVTNETFVTNNRVTKFTTVMQPLIHPIEGQYANYTVYYVDPNTGEEIVGGAWNFTYLHYISPYQINITAWMKDIRNYTQSGWMIVNIFTRIVERDYGIYWAGMWYPGWIETNVKIGSTINLLYGSPTITGSRVVLVNGLPIDCWEISYEIPGGAYAFWYDKASGLWIGLGVPSPYVYTYLMLAATNVPIGFMYEHDLAVGLDAPAKLAPGTSTILDATVYNTGLSNEANVKLQLVINDGIIASEVIPQLASGDFYTLSYPWAPPTEGQYNVTVYAPLVSGEEYTENNVKVKIVNVRPTTVALISDHSELLAVTGMLDPMGINYDVYNNNDAYLYTTDLDLLLNYKIVVFYTDYRWITPEEQTTLNSYLSFNGNLVTTGYDCLASDTRLADVVRSATTGDNWGQPDLYVVNASHPIMNGPYGSFPIAYHIAGLFSDCDAARAELSRGAKSVAQLANGYDKIIATEGIPGKVVFWNGRGDYDWTWAVDSQAMFKNTIDWMLTLHDVAIVNVVPSASEASVGDPVDIAVVAENQGNVTESFTVTAYASSLNSTKIYLDPASYLFDAATVYMGYRFNATVKVHEVTDLYAYQVDLQANDTMLSITGAWRPLWDPAWVFTGRETVAPPPYLYDKDFDGCMEEVILGDVLLGREQPTFTGDGLLAIIEFEITAIPPADGTLSSDLSIDNSDTYLLDSNANEIPSVTTDGYYALGWGAPPPPPPPSFYVIGTTTITDLAAGARVTLTFIWDTVDVLPRYYRISAEASVVPGETDTADNVYTNGVIIIVQPIIHDVAIVAVTPSTNLTYTGLTISINVTVSNEGEAPENFTVTLYRNITGGGIIGTQDVKDILPGEDRTLTFYWTTKDVIPGNYIVTAVASTVLWETDTEDNTTSCPYGVIVRLFGDINGDGKVDIKDLAVAAKAFGSWGPDGPDYRYPGLAAHPGWNPDANLNGDNKIDIRDLAFVAINFGKKI